MEHRKRVMRYAYKCTSSGNEFSMSQILFPMLRLTADASVNFFLPRRYSKSKLIVVATSQNQRPKMAYSDAPYASVGAVSRGVAEEGPVITQTHRYSLRVLLDSGNRQPCYERESRT